MPDIAVPGGWLETSRERLVESALAQIPDDASQELKLAGMEALAAKLEALAQWDRWDPNNLAPVVLKRNYREVESIDVGEQIDVMQVLPDGRIVLGGSLSTIQIWAKGTDGRWSGEELPEHMPGVHCLQALPDGRIVFGGEGVIRIWVKDADGAWSNEELKGHTVTVSCLQALPDGRIVSGGGDGNLRIWTKDADGAWSSEELQGLIDTVSCLRVLLDGRIVSGGDEGTLRIWTKGDDGRWSSKALQAHTECINRLEVLLDGRIVSKGEKGTLRIWTERANGGWSGKELRGHFGWFKALQALSDGRLVSGTDDNSLCIWTEPSVVPQKNLLSRLPWLKDQERRDCEVVQGLSSRCVTCLQVLPDGRILCGSGDGFIRIFDGEEVTGGAP